MRASWAMPLVLALASGCQEKPSVPPPAPSPRPKQSVTRSVDIDNGLEMGMELVSGSLKCGEECTVRLWLRNMSKKDIAIPKTPLAADMIPGRSSEEPWIVDRDAESWRWFYDPWRGPFLFSDDACWGGFDRSKPPSKALRIGEFREFCKSHSLNSKILLAISIWPDEMCERELTLRIRPDTGYLDWGFFLDRALGGILEIPPRKDRPEHKGEQREDDIWQGNLYVFLEISE